MDADDGSFLGDTARSFSSRILSVCSNNIIVTKYVYVNTACWLDKQFIIICDFACMSRHESCAVGDDSKNF